MTVVPENQLFQQLRRRVLAAGIIAVGRQLGYKILFGCFSFAEGVRIPTPAVRSRDPSRQQQRAHQNGDDL